MSVHVGGGGVSKNFLFNEHLLERAFYTVKMFLGVAQIISIVTSETFCGCEIEIGIS